MREREIAAGRMRKIAAERMRERQVAADQDLKGCKKQKSEITSETKRKIKAANFEELSCRCLVAM